ncbi:MAG: chemotaxis protein CheW [Ilumatobacteraceae bacterium]
MRRPDPARVRRRARPDHNLRGEIVTTIDLRRRLGLPQREQPAVDERRDPHPDGPVALVVDQIGDVIDADEPLRVPPTLSGPIAGFVCGVFNPTTHCCC